jgi:hypothetical protein
LFVVATDATPGFTRDYDGMRVEFVTLRRLIDRLLEEPANAEKTKRS